MRLNRILLREKKDSFVEIAYRATVLSFSVFALYSFMNIEKPHISAPLTCFPVMIIGEITKKIK